MTGLVNSMVTALVALRSRVTGFIPLQEDADLYLSSSSSESPTPVHRPFATDPSSVSTDGTAPASPALAPVSNPLLKALSVSSFSLSSSDEDEETEPVSDLPRYDERAALYTRKLTLRQSAAEIAKTKSHPEYYIINVAKHALIRFLVTSHPRSAGSHEERIKACALSIIPDVLHATFHVARESSQSRMVTLATRSAVTALKGQLVLSEDHLNALEVFIKQSIIRILNPPPPPPALVVLPRAAVAAPRSVAASVMPPPPPKAAPSAHGGAGARASFTDWSNT